MVNFMGEEDKKPERKPGVFTLSDLSKDIIPKKEEKEEKDKEDKQNI